jgi:hypothetical protein
MEVSMLSVKVWCLPPENEDTLKGIYGEIVSKIREIPVLSNSEEHLILVLFPSDCMSYGIGEEILVEAEFQAPCRFTYLTGNELAGRLGQVIASRYLGTQIAVKVKGYDGTTIGSWASK